MSLCFSVMTDADVAAVALIEARQHLTPWQVRSFEDALRLGWHTQVLRESTGSEAPVLGYTVSMTAGDDEELLTITVAPEAVGRGYGRNLIDALLKAAYSRGAQRLFLEVRESNRRAIHFYEAAGFTITGMRKNYYVIPDDPMLNRTAGREHAILMVRQLNEVHA